MDKQWAEVCCQVPAGLVDLLADFLVELSGNGVSIDNRALDTFTLDGIEELDTATVRAYFDPATDMAGQIAQIERFLGDNAAAFGGAPIPAPTVTLIRDEDWATGWRQHFVPTRIGRHLVIKPTWEPFAPEPGDQVIELDPGMAFGTGTHPTTRLCLEALETLGRPDRVLDVGTGSGILAIAAVRLGARQVIGTDIDPDAVIVAGENCALNGVEVELVTTPLALIPGRFDVVLANILAEDLVRMAGDLAAKVAAGGHLILSGILTEREAFVVEGFGRSGLALVAVSREGEWSCLVYRNEG
ncbi:50S ribosomal protein L11 methyltransferase [Geobacter sulfurreducens]|uniref:Ribosomal protein L11 methyltransferase n=1 Tax=Geobacter sulfurreducens (strain ATCC 51573 / DSM 12127 / PCA) TaxID=243231 RepID=PRMA_GEOSL|nr:50S ribosomal protein L11 methyltransferase [Geobacter sulfurreducens]Q74G05.1 RecName: Full=Ribosomal protein L11 methyltransferase; Short=L11 Mtase [Geobacter sulfurreducens PCA]AAR33779.1 ribosomal protein L11 methyltransferase [Geobacter sulfurreducens PCA]ADI83284.1 ribosomal protein L11 methyltransferase [Geobacter sulfurreducens KN400]AJY70169.1 ribosomal protein L11 methyltransferase [Geobacter sulfurreducens]UAC04526.1 50S ribosomal protein L11 methyltransferase [Geobacter sulfurre